ncbi:MAG: MFS transporter [Proteobacteria bacterium]|nr:MFS transporter [Pseudomonadota bacterium]
MRQSIWFAAFALIMSVTGFSISQGLTYPLLSILLQKSGESASMIGLNAAMTPIGIIVSAPFINRFGNSINRVYTLIGAIISTIIILLFMGQFYNLWLLFLLRFCLGISINIIYVLSETTLIEISPPSYRGRILGTYTSITNLGYACGPIILSFTGTGDITPFIVTSLILMISIAPLIIAPITSHRPERMEATSGSISEFLKTAWILVFAYASTTLFDNAFMSLFPSYGLHNHLTELDISMLLSAIMLGGVTTQIPIGWLIDKTSKPLVAAGCFAFGVSGFIVFPFLVHELIPALIMSFCWGASVLGIQTIALTELGDTFKGEMLVAGNSGFALMWGVSGVIGIPLAGTAMDLLGPNGLLLVVGGVFFISCTIFILRTFRR